MEACDENEHCDLCGLKRLRMLRSYCDVVRRGVAWYGRERIAGAS